jgi:hypothetical protein
MKTFKQFQEEWSNKYKKSINYSNPKGFSQRAHCAARRKRAKGEQTNQNQLSNATNQDT